MVKNITLADNPVLITSTDGNDYDFLPLKFTENGAERTEVAMFKNEIFVDYASAEIPYSEIYNTDSLSSYRVNELLKLMECVTIWGQYELYGTGAKGKALGENTMRIESVTELKKSDLADFVSRYASN